MSYVTKLLMSFLLINLFSIPVHADATYSHLIDYEVIRQKIYHQLHNKLEEVYGMNCLGKNKDTRTPSGYKCGELPFGKILNSDRKEIFKFKMKKGRIKNLNRGYVDLSHDVEFQILLDRHQYPNYKNKFLIDYPDQAQVLLKSEIYKNIFLRFMHEQNELNTIACTYLPGLVFRSPPKSISISGAQKKKFLFFSKTFRFSASANVDPGFANIKHTRICGVFKTRLVGNSVSGLNQQTSLVSLSYPEIHPFNVFGLRVYNVRANVHGWLAKLIVGVLKSFGIVDVPALIRDEVRNGLRKEIDSRLNVTKQQIMSGNWFKVMVRNHYANAPLTRKIYRSLATSVNSSTSNVHVFEERVEDYCSNGLGVLESRFGVRLNDARVNNFCRSLATEITVKPFQRRYSEYQAGCYARFFSLSQDYRIHYRPTRHFWKRNCHTRTDFVLRGPASSSSTQQCLLNQIIAGRNIASTVDRCQHALVRDLTGVRSVAELRSVVNAMNPVERLVGLGYTRPVANNIVNILGLGQ